MATLNAPSLANQPPIGSVGNSQVAFGKVTLAAAAANDVVRMLVIPAGAKVYAVKTIAADLGGTTNTLSVGYAPVEGSSPTADADKFSNDTTIDTSGQASVTSYNGAPIQFDNDVYLTLTVGTAAATGAVEVIVEYEYVGLK